MMLSKIIIKPLLLLSLVSVNIFADKAISQTNVNVRGGCSLEYKVIELIPNNTIFEIVKKIDTPENGQWYKIKRGCVFAELFVLLPTQTEMESLPLKPEITKEKIKITIKKEPVTVSEEKSEEKKLPLKSEVVTTQDSTRDIFIGISSGYSSIKADKTATLVTNTLDTSSYNVVVELGYNISENFNISLNYQKLINDSISLDNYSIASEYTLTRYKSFSPYLGLSVGISELSWETPPVDLVKQDLLSSAYIVGSSIGSTLKLNKQFSLNLNYMLSYMNKHTTTIQSLTQNGEIEYKLFHSFNFGVRYYF